MIVVCRRRKLVAEQSGVEDFHPALRFCIFFVFGLLRKQSLVGHPKDDSTTEPKGIKVTKWKQRETGGLSIFFKKWSLGRVWRLERKGRRVQTAREYGKCGAKKTCGWAAILLAGQRHLVSRAVCVLNVLGHC